MLGLFHESRAPWLLKDVEKEASRRGVNSMTVKDVVQSLIDDDLVHVDKIGSSNWYWAFPGEATSKARASLETAEKEATQLLEEKLRLEKKIETQTKKNPVTNEHKALSAEVNALRETNTKLTEELESFSSSNPETIKMMREATSVSKKAANVWTDNVFMMKSWAENKMGDKQQVKQFFKTEGVNLDTFDYVE